MTLSTIPGIQKRLSETGELVKCAVGKKHCCTVNTETLIRFQDKEVWYPICSEDCIGAMWLKLMKWKTTNYLEFEF